MPIFCEKFSSVSDYKFIVVIVLDVLITLLLFVIVTSSKLDELNSSLNFGIHFRFKWTK